MALLAVRHHKFKPLSNDTKIAEAPEKKNVTTIVPNFPSTHQIQLYRLIPAFASVNLRQNIHKKILQLLNFLSVNLERTVKI